MSKGAHDIFVLVIKFLIGDWQPKHVIIRFFEASEITGQILVKNLTELFVTYGLRKKILVFVKNGGFNINNMIITLKSVVNYEALGLEENY
jgi:hypothetical protein